MAGVCGRLPERGTRLPEPDFSLEVKCWSVSGWGTVHGTIQGQTLEELSLGWHHEC